MTVKKGPRGPFLGCTGYPKCRSTKPVPAELKEKLKDQTAGAAAEEGAAEGGGARDVPGVRRPDEAAREQARRGDYFLGCAKYPKCKGTREATPELLEQVQEAGAPL